jgi:hypothetical protein
MFPDFQYLHDRILRPGVKLVQPNLRRMTTTIRPPLAAPIPAKRITFIMELLNELSNSFGKQCSHSMQECVSLVRFLQLWNQQRLPQQHKRLAGLTTVISNLQKQLEKPLENKVQKLKRQQREASIGRQTKQLLTNNLGLFKDLEDLQQAHRLEKVLTELSAIIKHQGPPFEGLPFLEQQGQQKQSIKGASMVNDNSQTPPAAGADSFVSQMDKLRQSMTTLWLFKALHIEIDGLHIDKTLNTAIETMRKHEEMLMLSGSKAVSAEVRNAVLAVVANWMQLEADRSSKLLKSPATYKQEMAVLVHNAPLLCQDIRQVLNNQQMQMQQQAEVPMLMQQVELLACVTDALQGFDVGKGRVQSAIHEGQNVLLAAGRAKLIPNLRSSPIKITTAMIQALANHWPFPRQK